MGGKVPVDYAATVWGDSLRSWWEINTQGYQAFQHYYWRKVYEDQVDRFWTCYIYR